MKPAELDDVMAELDEFGKQTGGEHYDRGTGQEEMKQQQQQQQAHVNNDNRSDEAGDDLDQFMDEFELNTGGEDFRRPSPNK
jgi:hypothetical protein